MIIYDLVCAPGAHRFEGWFPSRDACQDQLARGLVVCPVCGTEDVARAPTATRLNAKANARDTRVAPSPEADPTVPVMTGDGAGGVGDSADSEATQKLRAVVAAVAAHQAASLPQSTWVGDDFARRARAMHAEQEPAALIHGQVSRDEAEALADDGVAVMPLLVPFVPPDKRN